MSLKGIGNNSDAQRRGSVFFVPAGRVHKTTQAARAMAASLVRAIHAGCAGKLTPQIRFSRYRQQNKSEKDVKGLEEYTTRF